MARKAPRAMAALMSRSISRGPSRSEQIDGAGKFFGSADLDRASAVEADGDEPGIAIRHGLMEDGAERNRLRAGVAIREGDDGADHGFIGGYNDVFTDILSGQANYWLPGK